MNILVVSHSMFEPTSRARWIALARRHPDTAVTLVVPAQWSDWWTGEPQPTPASDAPGKLDSFVLELIPTFSRGRQSRFTFKSVDLSFRKSKPDIIFVNQEPVAPVFAQVLLCRRMFARRARVVFISSDNVMRRWRKLRLLWMRVVNREIAMALAVNRQVREVLRKQGIVKPIRIQTAIGADESTFYPRSGNQLRRTLGLSGFVVGYVGKLYAAKGVVDLLHAFALLEQPKSLLIVGKGDLREELEAESDRLGLKDSVSLVGEVPRSRVPDLMRAMDVLVLPSRATLHERFGLVLAEAMLCGVPVIGSEVGGIPETIGDAGILFPSGDVAALATHLRQLQVNESLRSELAARGRKRALRKFSASALADETYDLFRQILAKAE